MTGLRLPKNIRSRFVPRVNGLRMHLLEAGRPEASRCLLLLHGFPELAFSWRYLMPALADAGYYVVAPDLRGFGRTTGYGASTFEDDPIDCSMPFLVNDLTALVAELGRDSVKAVVGHDSGALLAGWAALLRPDVFRSVNMMSAPFGGPPTWPIGSTDGFLRLSQAAARLPDLGRKHYQWYYSTSRAARDMNSPPQGMHNFLRAYFHIKSADGRANRPYDIGSLDPVSLTKLPEYYVMPLDKSMPETVAPEVPTCSERGSYAWLPDDDLCVYADEYNRTGFQGALQWYRCMTGERVNNTLRLFGGLSVDVPSGFIAGESDWGVHQVPGAYAMMQQHACTKMMSCNIVPGAGHWVQQEQPNEVLELLMQFLQRIRGE